MSYEGYREYLCSKGHHYSFDVHFEPDQPNCPHCNSLPEYGHGVDQTNGVEDDDPSTYPAPVKEVGWEDIWSVDHYGNKFATKLIKYAPDSGEWRKRP